MKRFSECILKETLNNEQTNLGVTNHYTPVQNILTNIKNLFCLPLGIVATIGEDGFSIKLTSSEFISQEKVNELLWRSLYNDVFTYGTSSLQGYITAQGLTKVTSINLGGCFVVYFSPEDIKAAKNPVKMEADAKSYVSTGEQSGECCPCPKEMKESLYDEFEFNRIIEGDDQQKDDQQQDDSNNQNKDDQNKDNNSSESSGDNDDKILEILNNEDKVKAAKQLEIIISQKISLPRDYYFTAIKFKNEDEAIALRWKYTKKLPTGNSTENTRSLIHIFTGEDKKIWVQDFSKDSIVELPKEVQTLIDNVLKILGAEKTNEPDIFTFKGQKSNDNEDQNQDDQNQDDQNQDDQNGDENNKDDKKSNKKDDKNKGDLL